MSISEIDRPKKRLLKTAFVYLLLSLLCALFGMLYEQFSHEVYSNYMIYAFAFPLGGGAFPSLGIALFCRRALPGRAAQNLYHSGIAALTVGSIFQGALEIYGTTNGLICVYWYAGLGFVCLGILCYAWERFSHGAESTR
ncbi:MAG: hypothetical protein PHE47_04315 [Oscillospiraceae bacterium]|nr:hypothetical protein [Oscillospiraceae bacterium]